MTPAGEAIFKQRHAYLPDGLRLDTNVEPPPSNDPFITCDPLGFPRNLLAHAISMRGGMLFGSAPNRDIIAYEQQRVWREIWIDGRELPTKVDVKGAPDSRYYGFSMKNQEFSESFCIPSEGIEYSDSLTKPFGIQVVK